MLICSCNMITKDEIVEVIRGFLKDDPWTLITPSRVYHKMLKRGRCCGCFPNLTRIIISETANFHRKAETPEADILPFLSAIEAENNRCETSRLLEKSQMTAFKRTQRLRS